MKIVYGDITLRDYQLTDVEDEVRWTNVDTAWFYEGWLWRRLTQTSFEQI